ncbi:unnamed protein product [Ceratitis capitata]|uniref:(Mediterranean fruit fly) hypothetical protein n=1 Tax=Ceratitis capitata TaxID=7213 RepID=A0A811UY45_CERCA|nr:unnamed protein product [Ceratitis capitata]
MYNKSRTNNASNNNNDNNNEQEEAQTNQQQQYCDCCTTALFLPLPRATTTAMQQTKLSTIHISGINIRIASARRRHISDRRGISLNRKVDNAREDYEIDNDDVCRDKQAALNTLLPTLLVKFLTFVDDVCGRSRCQ